jgi:potassium efflux system protein
LGFPLNAEPVNSETTDSATAVTPKQIADQKEQIVQAQEKLKKLQEEISNQKKEIVQAQAKLNKAQATVQTEEKALQEKIARLKKTDTIADQMLEKATEARQTASQKLENVRVERQTLQTNQDKKKASLAEREAQLKELTQSPPAEITATQKQEISAIKKEVALLKKAVKLGQQYFDIITAQIQENVKQTIIAIEWHAKLQTVQSQRLIQEREQEIVKSNTALENFKEILITQQKDLPHKIKALESAEETVDSLKEKVKNATLEKETTDVQVKNLDLEHISTEKIFKRQLESLQEQEKSLEKLRKTPPVEPEYAPLYEKKMAVSENNIELQKKKRELEQQHLDIIKQRLEQANKRLTLSTKWYDKLQPVYRLHQKQELEKRIQQEQQKHLVRAAKLRQELDLIPALEKNSAQRYFISIKIQEANEIAQRASRHLDSRHIENQLQQWQKTVAQDQKETITITQKQLDNEKAIIAELETVVQKLQALQSALQKRITDVNQQQQIVKEQSKILSGKALGENAQTLKVLRKLSNTLQQELDNVPILLTKSQDLFVSAKKVYQENMHRALLRHRTLPANTVEWWSLVKEIGTIPTLIMQQLQLTGRGFMQAFQQTSFSRWIVISIATLILLILAIGINTWGSRIFKSAARSHKTQLNLTENMALGLRLWHKNTPIIVIVGVFLLLLGLTQPNSLTVTVTLYLLLIGLGAKLLIDFFGLLLFSPNLLLFSSNLKSQDTIKLGRRIQFVIIVLALLTIVTALVHLEHEGQVGLSLRARDFVDTVFMVMLLLIIPPLVRARQLMQTLTQGRNRKVTGLITSLLAGAVLVVSLLGVLGYMTLGWTIAKYLSVFLLVLTGWLIAGGILKDLMQLWKNAVSKQGLYDSLWTEDIIPLAHNLLGLALLGLAVMVILWLTGWYSDVAIKEGFQQVLDYPLMGIENGKITVYRVFLSFLIIWVVFWFGAWSRRISYRWIFMNLTDIGVRHSLSIFIQYAVILIGLLIALKAMGIDPTALTVFAGAVGVGLGFGLQNIASNFISGILLLIERPLRVGDYVEIDSPHGTEVKYDGTVTHIGIRSLTLERRNAKKIIVPNSTIISSPFINQGGSTGEEDDSTEEESSAVRNTLNIGISYDSDLNLARRVIRDVLEEVPEVLSDPPFQVYLSEFTDFKVDFRIDYFVNMLDTDPLEVKSQVLYGIWTRFKAADITIPHSPVLVKTVSDSR